MFVALLAVFIGGLLYVRINELEHDVADLKRERFADVKQAQNEAAILVSHHRSGERPRGSLVLHNAGKGIATDVVLRVQRTSMPSRTPIITHDEATVPQIGPGQRVSVDTTTDVDEAWPIDVLVTWSDPRGPQSTARSVQR